MEITAQQLAAMVNGTVDGDASAVINNYAKIEEATAGCLTFLANPKYTHHVYTTQATAILVRKDFEPEQEVKATLIRVDDPYKTLADLLNFVNSQRPEKRGIEEPIHVGQGTTLPDDVYVGDNVTLGDDVILYPGVKIYHGCRIGNRCIVQGGAVIGGDGFGFAPKEDGTYEKIAQVGIVILEDDVEIGANSTIDRATMGATVIKQGAKLDNLIQIAHNVEVGECTVMAAQVGVAGSTKIGKYNQVGGQVGFAGHITVGDMNGIGAQTGVDNSIGSNGKWLGAPVQPAMEFARQVVYLKRLGDMYSDIKELKKKLKD